MATKKMENRAEWIAASAARERVRPVSWRRFLETGALVALATALGLPLRPFIEPTNLVMLYLLVVIITAIRLGRAPAILASVLSVIAFDLVFIPHYYTLGVADAQYLLTFAALLGVGLVISALAAEVREQARSAQRREAQTIVLYELSRALTAVGELSDVADIVVAHIGQTLGSQAVVLVKGDDRLEVKSASPGYPLDADEHAAANWTFEHGRSAGRNTNTLAGAGGQYLPLKTANEIIGVLGVRQPETAVEMGAQQQRLLESFASQTGLAIARSLLAEEARQAHLLHETEKLQTALLNSISHDLRTPLASITGALSSLREDNELFDERAQRELVNTAYEEAERLNRLVGNLLHMTRLESDALRLSVEPGDIEDVVGVALSQLSHRLGARPLLIDMPNNLPLVPVDFMLVVQVFVNLLDNAAKYAPADRPIELRARAEGAELLVEVADRGPGLPPEALERVFQKFYRVQRHGSVGGTGLGLSIIKGIVEAHGGHVWAQNRAEGGALFTVALPLDDQRPRGSCRATGSTEAVPP